MKKLISIVIAVFVGLVPINQVRAQQTNLPLTRERAISHLSQLLDIYQINLTSSQRTEVINVCRQIQAEVIQQMRLDLAENIDLYDQVVNSIDLSIRFTANALRQMSEDSSNMDLASFHLGINHSKFTSSANVYLRSLDELLIIDCQVYPLLFVAGLEEARVRQELILSSAEELEEYLRDELSGRFDLVEQRLQQIEAN